MARLQEESLRYIARTRVRDSSEITRIRQAQASSTHIPQTVVDIRDIGASVNTIGTNVGSVAIRGKGTNMEYTSILQSAEHDAVCGANQVQTNPYLALGTYVPAPCYDRNKPPFAQQDLTNPATVYVPPCKAPNNEHYFPHIVDSTCVYNRVITPSG